MKEAYILELKEALINVGCDDYSVLAKYKNFYDLGIEAGMTEKEVEAKLGSPTEIAKKHSKEAFYEEVTPEIDENNIYDDIKIKVDINVDNKEAYAMENNEKKPFMKISVLSDDINIDYADITEPEITIEDYKDSCFEVSNNNDGIIIKAKKKLLKGSSDIDIKLPRGIKFSEVLIATKSGDVFTADLDADKISLDSLSGDIECGNIITKNVRIHTASGDLNCCTIETNSADITTISGDLEFDGIKSKICNLKTVSGDIRIDDVVTDQLICQTTSGDIDISTAEYKTKVVHTVSGDVSINENN